MKSPSWIIFPMENITNLIDTVGQRNVITSLDIVEKYWEVPLEEGRKDLTWKTMAFGLMNTGAKFQRTMNAALADHQKYRKIYIDNIAVYSSNWKTHLEHLDIFTKLEGLMF